MEEEITFSVVKINPIGIWSYDIENDLCLICKNIITQKCVNCMNTLNDCGVKRGVCGHGYHAHCIDEWINKGSLSCPIDKTMWQEVKKKRLQR